MTKRMPADLAHTSSILVTDSLTVPQVSPAFVSFATMPPVFASAYMVALIEATCIECIDAYLDPGEHSVGTFFELDHIAPRQSACL